MFTQRRADSCGVMSYFTRKGPKLVDDTDRRVTSRLRTESLECDRGVVLDLSKTGARLSTRRPWKEGKTREISIHGLDKAVTLNAKCVWAVKDGLFKHTIGLHFVGVTEEQQRQLAEMARHFAARSLSDGYREAA